MKNKLIYTALLSMMLFACSNNIKPSYKSFKNVWGLIYYEPPQAGSMVSAVFVPFKDSDDIKKITMLSVSEMSFKNGIEFSTTNKALNEKFCFKIQSSVGNNNPVFWNLAKIQYHLERIYNDQNAVYDDLRSDTLAFPKQKLVTHYYVSNIMIDSILLYKPK